MSYRFIPGGPGPEPVTDDRESFRSRHRVAIHRVIVLALFAFSIYVIGWGAVGFWFIVCAIVGVRRRRRIRNATPVRVEVTNFDPDHPYDNL